ncbi:MAG: hypothetical protein K2W96_04265, partial [Gemmataceae bacterium]|nr:hypothetical protein [Gemmataceae bacterium]
VEAEAQRLGSLLRPVVHLYDARRKQLGWAWGRPALGGDARLVATLPADGEYTATIHDAEYAGGAPGHFRLKIGRWDHVESVFPPVVGKERKSVELLTSLGALKADLPLAWPKGGAWSGPRPWVPISDHAEMEAGSGVTSVPEGRVGVSGKLKEGEEAKFRLAARPGKLRLELFAERLGADLAASLVVRDDKGAVLARADEGRDSLDPLLEYTVPAKASAVNLGIVATRGSGIYRLVVGEEGGGFRLTAKTGRVVLPVGGSCVVPVILERRGFAGAVDLSATIPGARLEGTSIPAGTDGALVTVHRTGELAPALTRWLGKGGGREVAVAVAGDPLARVQPWAVEEIALAPSTNKAAEFALAWRGTVPDGIVPAKKLALPVKATRPTAPGTVVRLSLLTSQDVPRVNGQPDLNRAIRAERPVDLDPKKEEGDLPILIPADLPADNYELAVQADLLAADRRTVLATAYAPVKRFPVRMPLVVIVPAAVEAAKGKTAEIKGKVERREGLAGDVQVTATGMPPGVSLPPITVKGNDFVLKAALPAGLAPGTYPLKVSAANLAGTRVKSRDAQVTLIVK